MSYIATWLNEGVNAEQARLTVDDTLANLMETDGVLDEYMPIQIYDDFEFIAYIVQKHRILASVVAFGGELPVSQQGGFSQLRGELFKVGRSYIFDEKRQIAMKKAMELADARRVAIQNTMRGNVMVQGVNNSLADYLFGTIESMAMSIMDTFKFLSFKGIQTGAISYTDPLTNASLTIDYKDPRATYNHFPGPLTGNDRWNMYQTANGIQGLFLATDQYIDENGFPPDEILMSRRLRNDLLQQQSTITAAISVMSGQVATVSAEILNEILKRREVPPVRTFDEMVELEIKGENNQTQLVKTRLLNDNRFCFLKKGMGERAIGPTLEADGAPGIYTVAREIQKIPPTDAVQGVGTGLPAFYNPKLLYSQQVKD